MAASDPYRVCDECGGVDQHPRHTFAGVIEDTWTPNAAVADKIQENVERLVEEGKLTTAQVMQLGRDFWDTTSLDRHIDCCAAKGCPRAGTVDGCDQRVAVWNGKTGAGMVKAAEKVREDNPEHFQPAEEEV